MKSRFVFSAFCMLVAMTMATGAFAQGVFELSGTGIQRGRNNGHAEKTGGISLFLDRGTIGADDEGTIVINYGVPITNAVGPASEDNAIAVTLCGPEATQQEDSGTGNPVSVNKDRGRITITLDGDMTEQGCDGEEQISVENVLVSLVGSGASSVIATVTVTGDVRLTGSNRFPVIENVVVPLTDDTVKVGQTLKLLRHTGKPADSNKMQFHLVITEAHVDSFDAAQLELTFSEIPEDIEIVNLDAWVTSKKNFDLPKGATGKTPTDDPSNQIPIGGKSSRTATTDDDDEVVVYLQSASRFPRVEAVTGDDPTPEIPLGGALTDAVDVVVVRGSIKGADDDDVLPIDLDIQVAVELGPVGDDDDTNDVPRFDSDKTTPMTVVESTPFQTTLSAPFAIAGSGTGISAFAAYDTGVAVANMSSGSNAQPGTITFDFSVTGVGGDVVKMTHTTSTSSPNSEFLDENGMLKPGGTYAVLLGQLFPNAGNGNLVITTDFTNGDANIYISDFDKFSATGSVRKKQ